MVIKYEYNNKEFYFKLKENFNYSNNQIIGFFKNSLKKQLGISLCEYLVYKGYNIEKCRLCSIGDVPININFEIKDNFFIINGFEYIKKIYCYGNNKKCCGLKLNPNSFEFVSKVNLISLEEAKKILKENNKSPFYKENWSSENEYKKSQSRSIDYYIKKYGDTKGKQKYQEHINKISISNSIEGFINKYGNDEGIIKFNKVSKSKDSMSLKYFLIKNDGDYNKAIFEFEDRKISVNISLDSLISKYGKEEGQKKHNERIKRAKITLLSNPNYKEICKSKAVTLEKMIKNHGVELGNLKYNNWILNTKVPICRASKESLGIFEPLVKFLIENHNIQYEDIYLGKYDRNEFFLRDGNEIFFYDFTIRSKKIIIEYNGVTFHPKNENSEWINPFNNENAKTAFQRQKRKIELAEKNGFKVLELWSDETGNIEKCIKFIKNKYD
jgi:hypothetical protein